MGRQGHSQRGDRLLLLTLLVCAVSLLIAVPEGNTSTSLRTGPDLVGVEFRHRMLTYYRAPRRPLPLRNGCDPYDVFAKNSKGELLLLPSPIKGYSQVAAVDAQAYRVKTQKGSSILVYQVNSVLLPLQTDCHG